MGHTGYIKGIAFAIAIVSGGVGCAASLKPVPTAFTRMSHSFQSGGEKIRVDVYTPTARGRHLPVLVLHGAGGMLFDGPEMSRVAGALATAGFQAYQVHYFNRTHTLFARQAVLLKLFPIWRETVQDAVNWVRSERPDAPQIGLFGYSLGAFAAIETARRDPSIGAVVAEAGGFWHGHPEGPTRQPLPPLLVIHGTADTRVTNEKYTQPLLAFLREHNDPFDKQFYPGEGHVFSAEASAKVRERAVKFFRRHLR